MGRSSARTVNKRVDELIGLLKSRDTWITSELASELGVSHRTLMRDLEFLRDQGYPLEAERGRGGGVRLQRSGTVGRLKLDYREALDLLLCLAVMEKADSPLLLKNLRSIRRKIAACFSDDSRKRIASLRTRIVVGGSVSAAIVNTYGSCVPDCLEKVHQAFFEKRCLRIEYVDERGQKSRRVVEPQYLHYCAPIWYVMGWDLTKQSARSFRIDRIRTAELEDMSFAVRPEALFLQSVAHFSSSI